VEDRHDQWFINEIGAAQCSHECNGTVCSLATKKFRRFSGETFSLYFQKLPEVEPPWDNYNRKVDMDLEGG